MLEELLHDADIDAMLEEVRRVASMCRNRCERQSDRRRPLHTRERDTPPGGRSAMTFTILAKLQLPSRINRRCEEAADRVHGC